MNLWRERERSNCIIILALRVKRLGGQGGWGFGGWGCESCFIRPVACESMYGCVEYGGSELGCKSCVV